MGDDVRDLVGFEEPNVNALRNLKLMEPLHHRPLLLPAQKEIPPLTKIRVGPLPFNLHEFIEIFVKRYAVASYVNIHLGPELLSYAAYAQSRGGMFIRGVPLQNEDLAIKSVVQKVVGDTRTHHRAPNDHYIRFLHGIPPSDDVNLSAFRADLHCHTPVIPFSYPISKYVILLHIDISHKPKDQFSSFLWSIGL